MSRHPSRPYRQFAITYISTKAEGRYTAHGLGVELKASSRVEIERAIDATIEAHRAEIVAAQEEIVELLRRQNGTVRYDHPGLWSYNVNKCARQHHAMNLLLDTGVVKEINVGAVMCYQLVPFRCWDCGSTIEGHHTPLCDMTKDGDVKDLPQIEGTQWWTEGQQTQRRGTK